LLDRRHEVGHRHECGVVLDGHLDTRLGDRLVEDVFTGVLADLGPIGVEILDQVHRRLERGALERVEVLQGDLADQFVEIPLLLALVDRVAGHASFSGRVADRLEGEQGDHRLDLGLVAQLSACGRRVRCVVRFSVRSFGATDGATDGGSLGRFSG